MEICLKRYRGHKTIRKKTYFLTPFCNQFQLFYYPLYRGIFVQFKIVTLKPKQNKEPDYWKHKEKKVPFLKVKNYLRQYIEMNVAPVSFFRT